MVSTPLKNISQIGSFPQVGVNIKKYLKPPPTSSGRLIATQSHQPVISTYFESWIEPPNAPLLSFEKYTTNTMKIPNFSTSPKTPRYTISSCWLSFNPIENMQTSNWISSPGFRGFLSSKYLVETTTQILFHHVFRPASKKKRSGPAQRCCHHRFPRLQLRRKTYDSISTLS